MIVYIAGPMTGIDHFNFPAFHAAARALEIRGFTVFNPASKETLEGTDLPDINKLPVEWGGTRKTIKPGDIRRMDFLMINNAEAVVLLPGWESSAGALSEAHYAQITGKNVFILRRDFSLKKLNTSWLFKVVIEWHEKGYNHAATKETKI